MNLQFNSNLFYITFYFIPLTNTLYLTMPHFFHFVTSAFQLNSSQDCTVYKLIYLFIFTQELQNLEQSNATFVKEIAELKKELQLYTTALEQHIPHCTKLCPFEPSVTVTGGPSTATPSTSDITFSTDPNFLPDLAFLPESNSAGISLTDLLDSSDWYPWDSVNGNGCLQQF